MIPYEAPNIGHYINYTKRASWRELLGGRDAPYGYWVDAYWIKNSFPQPLVI
jgi:hypothetical protein